MDNFESYTYARTLRFFEAYYPYDNEDIHYANVMLSMNQCKTIDELIAVRECLKEKIKKIGTLHRVCGCAWCSDELDFSNFIMACNIENIIKINYNKIYG